MCGLADRETAEYPGGLCPLAKAGVRRGADDDKSSGSGWDPAEQGEEVIGHHVELVVLEFFRH